ncbi:hypothetical protein AOR_1_1006114 [Paecilomyces variotii No. 5]|uniref:BZIP domain-containing protein n=1 Tax=Byssochlamys spectabilis (strain No. 5 / NBRC 109023) TaxID=1356009 RepID=V5G9B7_BYSSN|nr:hypothetical protein AOR_1_1006114 [Paecilomyces variotii No. 5]
MSSERYENGSRTSNTGSDNIDVSKEMTMAARQRRSRVAGRPRQDACDMAISENRRKQIRQAQKTYRLRKEAAFQSTKTRLAELEQKISETSSSLAGLYNSAIEARLDATNPDLFMSLSEICTHLASDPREACVLSPQRTERSDIDTRHRDLSILEDATYSVFSSENRFGYHFPNTGFEEQGTTHGSMPLPFEALPTTVPALMSTRPGIHNKTTSPQISQTIERPIAGETPYTYCFQESTFPRRLQRYCVEYAYRTFSDPRSDPHLVYRMFRLVPCVRDRENMLPHFRRLARCDRDALLENPKIPFYCIGGAGKHYPVLDGSGNPIYPANMRLPKRILGIMPVDGDPGSTSTTETLLEILGLGGEWFDCLDIEGYLRACGVHLEDSTLYPQIVFRESARQFISDAELPDCRSTTSGHLGEIGRSQPNHRTQPSGGDIQVPPHPKATSSTLSSSRYVLDIEKFFSTLIQGLVVLGRVPGFRKSDVDTALKTSIQSIDVPTEERQPPH